jgi:hypothetical protein
MRKNTLPLSLIKAFIIAVPLAFVFQSFFFLSWSLMMGHFPEMDDMKWVFDFSQEGRLNIYIISFGFAFLQASLFLVPVIPAISLSTQKNALWPRVIGAAFLCSLVLAIPLFASIDILQYTRYDARSTTSILLRAVAGVWIISWLIWSFLIWWAAKHNVSVIERRALYGSRGSLIGLALCLPWYLVLRKKESCHCSLGTFCALVAGLMSLLFVGGPLLFILARDRKLRKAVGP